MLNSYFTKILFLFLSSMVFMNSYAGQKQIAEEIPHILRYLEGKAHPSLVLGVNIAEANLKERFDRTKQDWVFLNESHNDTDNQNLEERKLTVNFNNLSELQMLIDFGLCEAFETILVDDSTYKFSTWTTDHLTAFRNLLKPGGVFIFAPEISQYSIREDLNFTTHDSFKDFLKQQFTESSKMVSTVYRPYNIPYPANFKSRYENEVQEMKDQIDLLVSIVEATNNGINNDAEISRTIKELNLNLPHIPSFAELKNTKQFKELVPLSVYKKHLYDYIMQDLILPLNIKPFMQTVFGNNNVVYQTDVLFPLVKSNFKNMKRILVTAYKRNR